MIRSNVLVIDGGSSKSEVFIVDSNYKAVSCGTNDTPAGKLGEVIKNVPGTEAAYATILANIVKNSEPCKTLKT